MYTRWHELSLLTDNFLQPQEDDKPFQVTLSDESFETYELDPPSYTLDVTKRELKQMYYDMVVVRWVLPEKVHDIEQSSFWSLGSSERSD